MIRLISFAFLLSLVVGFMAVNEIGPLQPRPLSEEDRLELWKEFEQAQSKGLPKTAIEKLQAIHESAVQDKAWPEATLALGTRFLIEGQINQPVYPYVIRKWQAAIPEAPAEMKPVMNVMLAKYYFMYFQQNRWRFQQRSQTAAAASEDFETWDLARLLKEIDERFTEALTASDVLKQIPVADYDRLIQKGSLSDAHRPTLFDFVAFQALEFYSLDEQFIRQQGAFDIQADSPILASTSEFLGWDPQTEDEDSYLLKAVRLYQELLRFHADDQDNTALLDADLGRLRFGQVVTTGDESRSRYRAALTRFADDHVTHRLSATALGWLAQSIHAEGKDLVEAVRIAEQGKARFPNSVGGKQCHNLIATITSKTLAATTERVWPIKGQGLNSIELQYKNIDKVWFRLVEFDYRNWDRWGDSRTPQNVYNEAQAAILAKPAVKEWSVEIPETPDYQQRSESIAIEAAELDLRSGCYILLCSSKPTFDQSNSGFNGLSMAEVWFSNLAVISRRSTGDGTFQVQVVDCVSGSPIRGATVRKATWSYDGRNSRETGATESQTGDNGIATFKHDNNLAKLDITYRDQRFGLIDNIYTGRRGRSRNSSSTTFFTDRSIYRPGQTIQFKGICIRSNVDENQYQTLAGKNVQVTLFDANNQEVERRTFRTNEFGSFSGSFTAPRDRATGSMYLRSDISGAAAIRVEEYKRPKFYVKVEKPTQAFQLGQEVKIAGAATAYTGAAIDSAKVVWRVVRTVRYPSWYGYRYWYLPTNNNSQEIANGEIKTDTEGNFEIVFTAEPDSSVARENEPVFNYMIYTDVTDSAGETRSDSQSTSVGYTTLQASLTAPNWLSTEEAIELGLRVTTLDGEGQEANGTLQIYRLTPPDTVHRAKLNQRYGRRQNSLSPTPDLSKINAWPRGEMVSEQELATDAKGTAKATVTLEAGAYHAVYQTTDPSGNKVASEVPLLVHDPSSDQFSIKIANLFRVKNNSVEPGEEFVAVWGTGYESGQAFVEIEHRGKVLQSYWTDANATQHTIKIPIEAKHRGGLQLRISYVRENRFYSTNHRIGVPWSNKRLTVKWEHFVSKLQPGGKETWTAVVKGPGSEKLAAEFVAGMYDASLDAFAAHQWMSAFNVFYRDYARVSLQFYNQPQSFRNVYNYQRMDYKSVVVTYRFFRQMLGLYGNGNRWAETRTMSLGRGGGGGGMGGGAELADSAMEMNAPAAKSAMQRSRSSRAEKSDAGPTGYLGGTSSGNVDLSQVTARKNLNETAFFFPHLQVADDGTVRIEFEIPEALTKWKFMGFAHDSKLRSALLTDEMTTSKDLMVQPNPPRFLREGDLLEFSVKVSNQSDDSQNGSVRLTFADARTGESVDAEFGNQQLDQSFEIPARQSTSLYWKIKVPDFVGALTYKAVGATEKVSDGEEGFLPVLSKRILVTESLPLPIRGNETKTFDFERLKLAGQSDTLQSQTLTLQMTSNPAWYAVMALPYLMEYPHDCSEQVFNRQYANSLGQHIVTSDPKIERIFEQWRGTPALDSPLEKNEDLRNVLIAESPWLKAAKQESQSRRDVGILFDQNRLTSETRRALDKLVQMQMSDGAWPWFPGGRANDYITLYVTTGFGRLRHLGIDVDVSSAIRAVDRLDWWIDKRYQEIKRNGDLKRNNLSQTVCLYLYGRSFFLDDKPVADNYKEAFQYFVGQGRIYWPDLKNRQSQGHLAIGLKRIGDQKTPNEIMASLTERSLQTDEMGMFWREGEKSWWWYKAPIETQALMIEAYDEVANDKEKVEELKIWLLKQKQTQNWKTTKATADACYGLLLRGTDQLASDKLVQVDLGGVTIEPDDVEAGTGFYQQTFVRNEIKPEMGQIKLTKTDDGIAWGSIHWQYLEDVSKIEPYEGTPLTLKKGLFIKKNTDKGPVITEVDGPVNVGDELVMRVELRVDRAMEYVHLKDYRGSGTEPVNVLSRYKYQDGLAYYESTKDTASHFFIDYLPRGTYVFEYSVRVQHRGVYETGIAELQCMYAPEFNSHSGSIEITVE